MRAHLAKELAVLLLLMTIGSGTGQEPSRATSDGARAKQRYREEMLLLNRRGTKPFQVGAASWYGEKYHGKATASGEPFDMYALTAAHPSLPLGSYVRVTNLRNGRVVIVRINDRGPFAKGRIIDVSYSAARILGWQDKGVQRVRIDF